MTTPFSDTKCEGNTPLKYQVIIATYSTKSQLSIDSMVDATPPVLLCGLFHVHSKHSNRAVILTEQSCMTSYHITIRHNKKTKQTSV